MLKSFADKPWILPLIFLIYFGMAVGFLWRGVPYDGLHSTSLGNIYEFLGLSLFWFSYPFYPILKLLAFFFKDAWQEAFFFIDCDAYSGPGPFGFIFVLFSYCILFYFLGLYLKKVCGLKTDDKKI